jgi:hypothetical protein
VPERGGDTRTSYNPVKAKLAAYIGQEQALPCAQYGIYEVWNLKFALSDTVYDLSNLRCSLAPSKSPVLNL